MSRLFLITTLTVALTASAQAGAILNTLQSSRDADPGWTGGLDGMVSGSGGNTEKQLIDLGGRLQWRGEAARLRLQLSGGYEESDREVKARHFVTHLRHNRDLSARWATIAFTQVQLNPFQQLTSRWLLGAGLRHDFIEAGDDRVSLGATPMLEIERLENQDGHLTRGRLSAFLSASHQLSPTARVSAMGFWQPLFSDLADARAVGNVAVAVAVTGSIELKVGAAVEYDSRPPEGVDDTDWTTYAGFGVGF